MSDIAIMMTGHVSIPIYPTLNDASINQILTHSESKAIIIGKLDNFESQKVGIPDIHKISIGLYDQNIGDSWEDLLKKHPPIKQPHKPQKDDLASIIYTSGTTGTPKGVMHTVGNFVTAAHTFNSVVGIAQKPSVIFVFTPRPYCRTYRYCYVWIGIWSIDFFCRIIRYFCF